MQGELALALPEVGLGAEATLEKLRALLRLAPRTSSRRFANQLFAGREEIATVADMLVSATNTTMATYKAGGAFILVEQVVLERMLQLVGFEDGDGSFVAGGSLANLVACAVARNEAVPTAREQGVSPPLAVYTSREAHYSLAKNASLLGLGRESVRKVATDSLGKLDPAALRAAIERDLKEGERRPAMVVATAGTTVRGVVDPLEELAFVAEQYGLWLHVDAAFGGSLVLHPEQRFKLAGIERADSVTWDPHKVLGVPLPCSVVLMRTKGLLRKHLDEAAPYLFQLDSEDLNPGRQSIHCGRRNDALKLWALWQHLGDRGLAERLDQQLELARYCAARVEQSERLVLCQQPESFNVCFYLPGVASDAICEELSKSGEFAVGWGEVERRKIIRLVTTNNFLRKTDIDSLLERIEAFA